VKAIVAEWNERRTPDFEVIRAVLNTPVVPDGRSVIGVAAVAVLRTHGIAGPRLCIYNN
jgi:hypothetical protein